jgi:hypothetical protein
MSNASGADNNSVAPCGPPNESSVTASDNAAKTSDTPVGSIASASVTALNSSQEKSQEKNSLAVSGAPAPSAAAPNKVEAASQKLGN